MSRETCTSLISSLPFLRASADQLRSSPDSDEKADFVERGAAQDVNPHANLSAKIKNPLAQVSPEQLKINVEQFARENELTDILPVLMKGAFVAKDPPAFESVEGLTEDEKTAIRNEVLHKWRQPKSLFFTIILCSVGAAVQ